jgi:hypothetical protein
MINVFRCDRCGEEAFISVPLLYHDMERKFMVQFHPLENLRDEELLERFTEEGEITGMENLPCKLRETFKRIQIVFDVGEMVRYIIFRERVHELWKDVC